MVDERFIEELDAFLAQNYSPPAMHAQAASVPSRQRLSFPSLFGAGKAQERVESELDEICLEDTAAPMPLENWLESREEDFSTRLLRYIDERCLPDSFVYKRAGIDRRLFSKIRSNPDYHPSKNTALALAVALELSLDETSDLLESAGLALSNASRFDLIVKYFIMHGIYDRLEINEALYRYGESLLGA